MIRLAHISDSHFDERGRLEDVVAVHRAFLEQAKAAGVDLIVHAGDWFERRSTPLERLAVANFLEDASEIAPVFGVKGNHDVHLDLSLFPRLDARHEVAIADRPTATPGSAEVWKLSGGRSVGLLALPWFDKAHLVAGLDATTDAGMTRELTIEAARELLTCLRAEATRLRKTGAVPILVSHVLVGGSEVSTGQVLIGTTVELAPSDLLDVGAAYAALGHVHKAQEWHGGRVAYSGSPHRCNYGEPEAKGWRLVTLEDDGRFVSNEFMELPARRIVLLEADWTGDGAKKLRESGANAVCWGLGTSGWRNEDLDGALVRFRYHVAPQDLHLVPVEAFEKVLLADGAHEVQLECVIEAETRVRAGEIVLARSTAEKVDAYLSAKQIEIDAATRVRVHAKLAEIEGGAHAAA